MADTVTANYGWVKPEIAGSSATWGGKLNGDLDLIDAQVFTNQTTINALNAGNFSSNTLTINKTTVAQGAYLVGASAGSPRWWVALGDGTAESGSNAGSNFQIYNYDDTGNYLSNPLTINRASGRVQINYSPVNPADAANKQYVDSGMSPVGAIILFAGITPPAGWAFCQGAQLSTTTYAALFATIGYRFGGSGGLFNLPDLRGRVPVGYDGANYGMGNIGGTPTHTLTAAEMPSHAHGVSDSGHVHGVNDPTHAHSIPVGPVGPAGYTYQAGGGNAQATSGATSPAGTGINIAASLSNIAIQAAGGGAAHNIMQPYQVIGYIIRIQ